MISICVEQHPVFAGILGKQLGIEMPSHTKTQAIFRDEKLSAVVGWTMWDRVTVEVHVVVMDPRICHRHVLSEIFDYPFGQMDFGRVVARINKSNARSRRLVMGLGFVQEGILREASETSGEDIYIYGLLKREFRYGSSSSTHHNVGSRRRSVSASQSSVGTRHAGPREPIEGDYGSNIVWVKQCQQSFGVSAMGNNGV